MIGKKRFMWRGSFAFGEDILLVAGLYANKL